MSRNPHDGASRLKARYRAMLDFIESAQERHAKEVEGYMLNEFGVTPETTQKYLLWAEQYGQIKFLNPARNRVKRI